MTEIKDLGEFGLIKHLTQDLPSYDNGVIKGIGDDAAILLIDGSSVITTDMLIEGVHFDLIYTPLKHLGYKAVAVNISDICAMNATPLGITVSLGISNRFTVEALEELYDGIKLACKKYKINIIGGDTCSSQKGLVISITAIGKVSKENVVYRNTAQLGDLLCVSGDLGAAYLGLQLLEREKQVYIEDPNMKPNFENKTYLLQRQMRPEARIDIIEKLAEVKIIPTAMIDISDGLSSEIFHLSEQSRIGFKIYEEKLPIHDEAREQAYAFNIDPTLCALSGGEDYELLFTIRQADYNQLMLVHDIHIIGHAVPHSEGNTIITRGGNIHPLKALGWNAFTENTKG